MTDTIQHSTTLELLDQLHTSLVAIKSDLDQWSEAHSFPAIAIYDVAFDNVLTIADELKTRGFSKNEND